MKVTLDLTRLLDEGKITREEHDRLLRLGAAGTGSLAFNILIGFGVIAVALGAIALIPDPTTGVVLGVVVLTAGLSLYLARLPQWEVLAHICVLIGALGLAGGIVVLTEASVWSFLGIAAGFAIAGIIARSGLLTVLSVLALSSALGARSGYEHATYMLGIEEPTLTIVVFSVLALGAYLLSKIVPSAYERLALQAARAAIFLVNFGFWIGSLWGDSFERWGVNIDDTVYAILWAVALIGVGVWGARANRRWVVNIAAIFAAIHFYTQWFERLGPNPLSVLMAGILALVFAIGLWQFNRALFDSGRHPALTT